MSRASESREFRLAAACCRPAGPLRDRAVRAAAEGVDWRGFVRIAERHRIEGLAHEALRRAAIDGDPAAIGQLREAARGIAVEGLRLAAEAARLQAALEAADVANLVLKGATLDALAWGRIGLKRAWDIDLLVTPADAGAARAVLEAAGYRLADPPDADADAFLTWVGLAKESVFRRRDGAPVVELHWRLTDAATLLPGLSATSPAQVVDLAAGFALRTLAAEELFAYLCVHGAAHAWSRLKWLADLGALLAREDEAGRAQLFDRARDLGAGHCPAAALLLCERLFDLPLPTGHAAAIRADRKARRLTALALDAMAGGGAAEIDRRPWLTERILLSQLLFADGWRFQWAEWSRQWVSVDDRMRLRLPLPLAFLYAPLRAPLWLWRRLSRALTRP